MGYERDRGGARARGYDGRWSKATATFRQRNPWCRGCLAMGKQVKVEAVDHVEPHKGDQAKFWNTSMWQSACRWHHDAIKKQLEAMWAKGEIAHSELWLDSPTALSLSRRQERRPIGADGWPVEG